MEAPQRGPNQPGLAEDLSSSPSPRSSPGRLRVISGGSRCRIGGDVYFYRPLARREHAPRSFGQHVSATAASGVTIPCHGLFLTFRGFGKAVRLSLDDGPPLELGILGDL